MNASIHARFFGLLKQLPGQSKEDLVWQYSNMLTDSLSEFCTRDPQGYARMINDLQTLANRMNKPEQPQKPTIKTTSATTKKLRSGILKGFRSMVSTQLIGQRLTASWKTLALQENGSTK